MSKRIAGKLDGPMQSDQMEPVWSDGTSLIIEGPQGLKNSQKVIIGLLPYIDIVERIYVKQAGSSMIIEACLPVPPYNDLCWSQCGSYILKADVMAPHVPHKLN